MKKKACICLWAIVTILLCGSCSSEAVSTSQVENQDLTLSFFESSIQPLNAKRKAASRADDANTSKALKDCDFVDLNIALIPTNSKDATIYFKQNKTTDADAFGSVKMKVPVGTYHIVAIASKKDADVKINSLTEVVFQNKVTDMAYIFKEITVKSGSTNLNCLLKRAVSKFTITNTGTRGSDVAHVKIQLSGNCGRTFNPTTGLAAATSPLEVTLAPSSKDQITADTYSIYAFLTTNQEKVNTTVTILDNSGSEMKTLSFNDVVLKTNYVTVYKGNMFDLTSNAEFTFSGLKDFDDSGTGKEFTE